MFNQYAILALSTIALSYILTWAACILMRRGEFYAQHTTRSSHTGEVLIGGGWPVLITILAVWLWAAPPASPLEWAVLASVLFFSAVSWIDDILTLSALLRLLLQFGCVALILYFVPGDTHIVWNDLPLIVDRVIAAVAWVWFINLFNFMDGIDGLACVEGIFIALSISLLGVLAVKLLPGLETIAIAIAGALAGFLPWNWHRAKIFLGDTGVIPLGFILGYLLLQLALNGHGYLALILPLYFLTDATVTLLKRIWRREKFWQPHRQHYYQRAASKIGSHSRIVWLVVLTNLILLVAAWVSLASPMSGVLLAVATVGLLLLYLEKLAHG